jgi:translation initiation factor eIF-2B subunit epsilon
MPKKKGGEQDDGSTAKREDPLQAVLLADAFVASFRPLSLDRPPVLSPLNNVTLLDYALDFLAGSGVAQLFVVCRSDQVAKYLDSPTASYHTPRMQITVIQDANLSNAGDALRELDRRDLIQSDPFILMFGDTVTNVDLSVAIATHKARHKKDPTAIMTICLKPVGASEIQEGAQGTCVHHSSIRACTEDLVVGIDAQQDNRILLYDDHPTSATVALPCSFFSAHSEVDVHFDLMDCGIDLCSPDVLARFQDEFDYGDIRRHFVANSVAEEEEGLQNKIYAHILNKSEYAARVTDFATYAAVSRDVLRRWCWPIVPDNLPEGYKKAYRYVMQRHYMYYEQKNGKTQVGRGTIIRGTGMMGAGCSVGETCSIEQTVVGHGCQIGSKATILGSILWDNVEVESGVTIVESILANDVVIKEGAILHRGCVVGAGCIIGKGVVLPEFSRVTMEIDEEDDFANDWSDDEENENTGPNAGNGEIKEFHSEVEVVGTDGKGRVWRPPLEDGENEEMYGLSTIELTQSQSLGFNPSGLFAARMGTQSEDPDNMSEGDEGQASILSGDDYDDNIEFGAPTPTNEIVGRQKGVDVVKELKSICLEYEVTSPIENLAIELNSFKFSQNASYSDCTMAAIMAILERLEISKDTKIKKLVENFTSSLKHWSPLLEKMSIGLEEEKAIILGLEACATGGGEMGEVLSKGVTFRFFLQVMHDEEVVNEEAVLAWAAERKEEVEDSPRGKIFRAGPVQDFLEWLEDEEDDDSEEGDEESSDDE